MKLEFPELIFEKYKNIKFYDNFPSGNCVFPCRQTDRQTDMTKLLVTSYNFVIVPKK